MMALIKIIKICEIQNCHSLNRTSRGRAPSETVSRPTAQHSDICREDVHQTVHHFIILGAEAEIVVILGRNAGANARSWSLQLRSQIEAVFGDGECDDHCEHHPMI